MESSSVVVDSQPNDITGGLTRKTEVKNGDVRNVRYEIWMD